MQLCKYKTYCGAIKMIEYSKDTQLLKVHHRGKHSCTVKPNLHANDSAIKEAIAETGGALGPRQMAHHQMTHEMKRQQLPGDYNMTAIIDIAKQFTVREYQT